MRILCIDVGRGTQDILLYDSERNLENCTQLIIPSRAVLAAEAMKKAISEGRDILFTGTTQGGFPLGRGFKEFAARRNVYAVREASVTFRDDPDVVREMGVKVVTDDEATALKGKGLFTFDLKDVDMDGLLRALELMGEGGRLDGIAVAVQDHGAAPKGMSDREFRFNNYRKILEGGGGLSPFFYRSDEVPSYLTRMRAVASYLAGRNLLLMDTGIAAVMGSLEDEKVAAASRKLLVNVGNGHTLAILMDGVEIQALFEHHTSMLDGDRLSNWIEKVIDARTTHEDVFADGGHGLYLREGGRFGKVDIISVIGPNRGMLNGRGYYHPSPHGNMMLAGSYGLLRAYMMRFL